MGLLIAKTDFTGKYKVAQNSYTDIDSYIEKYEEIYLAELLGADLFALFKADVNPTTKQPVTAIYLNIYNSFKTDEGNCLIVSEGMKKMILGFIYFEYVRDEKFKATMSGIVVSANEVSRESGFTEFNLYSRYNESIDTYDSIQWYICKNKTSYTEFNGQSKSRSHWAI